MPLESRLMKSAKEPDQQNNRNRNSDQPQE
jgi:hypothetical protein